MLPSYIPTTSMCGCWRQETVVQRTASCVCHLGVEVQAHDAAGGVAQELGVGGVLQGEHADHASLGLLVEIICGHAVKGTLLSGH